MSDQVEEIHEESFSSDEEFDDGDDSESSTDVDAKLAEDDVFDAEFFKCYSALKKKDNKIYDQKVKFFSEEIDSDSQDSASDDKETDGSLTLRSNTNSEIPKMTLLDHQLNLKDDEIEDLEHTQKSKIELGRDVTKSFYEKELDEIKKSIEKVGEDIDSDDDLLVAKDSNSESKPRKTISAILDKMEENDNEDISHLKQIWTESEKLSEEDKFLRDYILNKRYLPTKSSAKNDGSDKGFFSKNLDDLSDVEADEKPSSSKHIVVHHSDDKDFDKISRIPRNSTKTIRDLVERQEKKEKRLKMLDKKKKKKKSLKEADFEDLVGDLPTKFHYRETLPNDYGLSAEELLMATDEELDKWVSLKNAVKYKSHEEELAEKERYEQRRNDLRLKKEIFKSIYGEGSSSGTSNDACLSQKKNKRKRGRDSSNALESSDDVVLNTTELKNSPVKKKKKHKRGLNHKKFIKGTGVAPDRLLAYGLSKNKLKKSKLL